MATTMLSISVLLSVSSVLLPFLMPDTCRGEFLFFLPNQRKWIGKTPCCYNCGTPPTLFWPNPLPSSALLTPVRVCWFLWVAPARALCLFETPASKGTPKLCQGFRVRLNLKYYLRPATTQFPAQVWKCKRSASALGAVR